jgi:predicted nuclease of predicted toxin-antitoxin system
MRFLANENFPLASIRRLRQAGYDVIAIIEEMPGAKDMLVLTRARQEQCILLTFDRDYGELIYRQRQPVPVGVIYFRFEPVTPEEPADRLVTILKQ